MNIPVRINMGQTDPSGDGKVLGKRELYIYKNGDSFELWVGNPDDGSAEFITVLKARNAQAVDTGNNMLNTDRGIIAGMEANVKTVDASGNRVNESLLKPYGDDGKVTFESFIFNSIKEMTVADSMYGSTLPEEGTEGQIFFKI